MTLGAATTKIGGRAATDGTTAKSLNVSIDATTAADVSLSAATATPNARNGKTATGFGASPSAQAKPPTTGFAATSDPAAATTTTTAAGPATAAPQPNVAGKTDTDNSSMNPANSDTTAPAAAPAPPSRDHIAIDAGTQTSTTTDTSAQVAAAIAQQQPSSATPTAATPTFTVVPATGAPVPVSGLAVEIAASVQSGKTRFEVRLDPADLGRIDVRIDVDRNGQVTSHLTVEKPETLAILQQDAPQLQQALNDAGLKTGNGGLQFSLRDQSSSGQNSGNQPNGNAQQLVINEDDGVPAAIAGQSYGRMLSASGGIDIRV
jgi:flagellar hook-length control protein FliK